VFGRERDCELGRATLLSGKARLLTLIGPPGVGKTRLALALAEALQDEFAHGAIFVDLSPVRSPELVLETVAQSFGLRQQGNLAPVDQLEGYLRDLSVLLVLDNFEHVVEASPEIARLLAQTAGLVVLATSRTALRVRWEVVFEVAPLDPVASVAFFVDRARAGRADFACAPADLPVLTEICTRLDGLPLAIELAAARCVVLSPHDILNRLSRRLVLLTDAPRDASSRHRTLRSAIDWSYDLLADDERALLRHLSVFVGGFALDAAEAVFTPLSGTTFDCLSSLIRMSLVRFEARAGDVPESRFRLLETVREYAWEYLLAQGEADEAQFRHAEYLRAFVEREYWRNFGPDQPLLAGRLEREHPNLRQALGWAMGAGQIEIALRLGGGLHWFWYGRGYLAEGMHWLEQALARADTSSPLGRAVASRAAGALALNQGKFWAEAGARERPQRDPLPRHNEFRAGRRRRELE